MCFAVDCDHKFGRTSCANFRFPTNRRERKKWIDACRRFDRKPKESDRVCKCHFVDGKRHNGPTLFSWNATIVTPPKFNKPQHHLKPKKDHVKTRALICKANKVTKKCNGEVTEVDALQTQISDLGTKKELDKLKHFKSEKDYVTTRAMICKVNKATKKCNGEVTENDTLQTQISNLRKEIEKLKKHPFGYHCVENDEKLLLYYTGLTKVVFYVVLDSCAKSAFRYFLGWKVEDLDLKDQLLITLMKLRLNLDYFDLAVRFNTSEDTINNIVLTFVNLLHEIWYVRKINEITSEGTAKPDRMIVGFAEIDTVVPEQTDETDKPSKKYKNTLKCMVAIDPNGGITHCSMLYPASTHDKVIMKRSGIAEKYQDIEFTMIDGSSVSSNTSLEVDSEVHTQTIKRLRDFSILNFIPKPLFTHSSKVFQVCGALANLVNPRLKLIDQSNATDVKEESGGDDIKTEFDEEVSLEFETAVFADGLDTVSCKSEPLSEYEVEFSVENGAESEAELEVQFNVENGLQSEAESEVEFIMEEFDLELEEEF
ncbi:uncharacterized protein LOC135836996 [Planococcus citri]|uniref:uncharacterized protein LOC135836996 n=1 Tax=Planococcus citri TaxID=170843 RepID=UPI0031FA0112